MIKTPLDLQAGIINNGSSQKESAHLSGFPRKKMRDLRQGVESRQSPLTLTPRETGSSTRNTGVFRAKIKGMGYRDIIKKGIIGLLLLMVLFLPGCRLTYLFHAAKGQFRLLYGAIPVEEALQQDALSREQKGRLRLVAGIKAFGEKRLGLKKSRSYETVYLKSSQVPAYCVSACSKDSLTPVTWWFPIVGDMPYLGFFDLIRAREEKKELIKKDLDVIIGMADAYSTLGWFRDPVTLNLIKGSTMELVEIILHEMTHTTLYVKGQASFNEGLANLVGKTGALVFLRQTFGPTHPFTMEARKSIEDERIFSSFLASLLKRLEALYGSSMAYRDKLEQRKKIFSQALQDYQGLKDRFQTDRFLFFGSRGLDNAYLMSVGLYHRHFHAFEAILEKKGHSIKEMLAFLSDMAADDGDMLGRAKAWLDGESQKPLKRQGAQGR
ncbi:MAG: aminopeptidase [Deltaproteobacteria bacterium]|nr:aminopeptidase [Deltaproteobacteria bacterium]